MSTQQRIAGVWLPLVTPFKDGRLDETSLTRLVRHYTAEPVDGLILAAECVVEPQPVALLQMSDDRVAVANDFAIVVEIRKLPARCHARVEHMPMLEGQAVQGQKREDF